MTHSTLNSSFRLRPNWLLGSALIFGLSACSMPSPLPTPFSESVGAYLSLALVALGLLGLATSALASTEEAPLEEEAVDRTHFLGEFDTIDMSGALNALVVPGTTHQITLRGTEQEIRRVRFRQYGNQLVVKSRFWGWWGVGRALVTITTPDLVNAEVTGACFVRINGFENLTRLTLEVTGASNVAFNGRVADFNVEVTGASKLDLQGKAEHLYTELTGASTLNARELEVTNARVELVGACSAHVFVTTSLRAELVGASSLHYRGNPQLETENVGANSIKRERMDRNG